MEVDEAAGTFAAALRSTPPALAYVADRLLLDQASTKWYALLDRHGIGCTPVQWTPSFMAGRITFPMYYDQHLVAFRGRRYWRKDEPPKTMVWPNSQDDNMPVGLTPGTIDTLKDEGFCVLVEGEFDMLSLWRCGIPAVASCTMSLQEPHAWSLSLYVDCVLIWIDREYEAEKIAAVRKASLASARLLESYGVKTAFCIADAPNKDANDVLLRGGTKAICQTVRRAIEAVSSPVASLLGGSG